MDRSGAWNSSKSVSKRMDTRLMTKLAGQEWYTPDPGAAGVFWNVAIVRQHSGIAHYRGSQCPGHYKSKVAACCGTGAGSASARSRGRLESVRCMESDAAVSLPYASGFRPKTCVERC